MRKVTLLKALHSSLARRWTAVGDLRIGVGRAGVCTVSGSDLEPFVDFDNQPVSSGRHAWSGNSGRSSKLRVQGIAGRGETFLLGMTPNCVIAQFGGCQYSTVPEPKVDQGGIVPIPLAQTGEGR